MSAIDLQAVLTRRGEVSCILEDDPSDTPDALYELVENDVPAMVAELTRVRAELVAAHASNEHGDPPEGSRLWRCEKELAKAREESALVASRLAELEERCRRRGDATLAETAAKLTTAIGEKYEALRERDEARADLAKTMRERTEDIRAFERVIEARTELRILRGTLESTIGGQPTRGQVFESFDVILSRLNSGLSIHGDAIEKRALTSNEDESDVQSVMAVMRRAISDGARIAHHQRKEIDRLEMHVKGLADETKVVIAKEAEALAKLRVATAAPEDVWMWQPAGGNYPETLACPVVMSADTLRTILTWSEEAARWVRTFVTEVARPSRAYDEMTDLLQRTPNQ